VLGSRDGGMPTDACKVLFQCDDARLPCASFLDSIDRALAPPENAIDATPHVPVQLHLLFDAMPNDDREE